MNVIVMGNTIYYDISKVQYKEENNTFKLGQMPYLMERILENPKTLLKKFGINVSIKEAMMSCMSFLNDSKFIITNHKILKLFSEKDYLELEEQLSDMYGRDTYDSDMFYKNFPHEVKSMTSEELYFNAMVYYVCGEQYGVGIGDVRFLNEVKKARRKLKSKNYKKLVIKLINFNQLLTDLINLKQMNDYQLTIVEKLINNDNYYMGDLNDIVSREHKSLILKRKLINKTIQVKDINSSNDLLNIMVDIKGTFWSSDVLIKPTRFARRFIIDSLDTFIKRDKIRVYSEIKRHIDTWKDIFNLVHIFEHNKESVKELAKSIYNNVTLPSTYTNLEEKLKKGDFTFLDDFINNPTEIYRRLNHISKIALEQPYSGESFKPSCVELLTEFIEKTINKIPTDVLCTLYKHNTVIHQIAQSTPSRILEYRNQLVSIDYKSESKDDPYGVFYSKQSFNYKDLIKEELKNRFNKFDSIDIDEKYLDIVIPFKQSGKAGMNSVLSSGSRIKIEDTNKNGVRFFIYWKGKDVDLDLSVYLINRHFESYSIVGFQNLRKNGITHSGDITSAPNGASEYIDVDFSKLDKSVSYILKYVNSFRGQLFEDIEDCYAGMMVRPTNNIGEVYETKTVENTFKMTSKSTTTYPLLIDVTNKEIIVIDKTIQSKVPARAAFQAQATDAIIAEYYVKRNFFTMRDCLDIMEIEINKEDTKGEEFTRDILFNNLELLQKIIKVTT